MQDPRSLTPAICMERKTRDDDIGGTAESHGAVGPGNGSETEHGRIYLYWP
jgi:hypothetical protein